MPAIEDCLLSPLVSYSRFATWEIAPADSRHGSVLLQNGPSFFSAQGDIIPFVLAAAGNLDIPDPTCIRMTIPGNKAGAMSEALGQRLPGKGHAKYAPEDPLAKLMWLFWPEMMTPDQAAALPPGARPDNRVGFMWRVWYGPAGVEGSFQAKTHRGAVIPVYNIDRRPLEEVGEAMAAPGAISAFIDAMGVT